MKTCTQAQTLLKLRNLLKKEAHAHAQESKRNLMKKAVHVHT